MARTFPLIGIFGGTFDPVHRGHLAAARSVRDQLSINDFRFLPAGDPPHRQQTHAAVPQRLEMLTLALEKEPGFHIDTRELHRTGPSFMVHTLESVRAENPDSALLLIMGQDSANKLDHWHQWNKLFRLAHLVVMNRPGDAPSYSPQLHAELASRWVTAPQQLRDRRAGLCLSLTIPPLDISSTEIRRQAKSPERLRTLVPDLVSDYIGENRLYGAADVL